MTHQLMMMHLHTKFGNKMFGDLADIICTNIHCSFVVTLTLNAVIYFFHKILWLLVMYHQTRFGCQRISRSEDIVESHMLTE